MKLYKYKSLRDLWHVLDVVVNQRLYCAHWSELNDPLEGRYEICLGAKAAKIERMMMDRIEFARAELRIASLSAVPDNFLLWSHYADGHKGVAIEIEIPQDHPDLMEVTYSPFSSVFTEKVQTKEDMRHLFNGKSEEWSYEREYRVVAPLHHFELPHPVSRLLLGPLVSEDQVRILRAVLPPAVALVQTGLDRTQGLLRVSEGEA